MNIAIDIRTAIGNRLGKGVYTHGLVSKLLEIDRENQYLLLTDNALARQNYKNTEVWIGQPGPLWHFRARQKILQSRVDLFFSPTSFITPALLPPSVKIVIVVHDLVAFLFPAQHQTKATIIEKLFLKRALRKSSHIITVSENTKKDLVKFFPLVSKKPITVVYPAASEIFSQEIPKDALEQFRREKNLPEKFFLFVGTLEPRKNLEILLDAFDTLRSSDLYKNTGLVIVGSEGWKNEKLLQRLQKSKDAHHDIHLLPYLQENELAKMYYLASAFIFPSLYEGFGIPPLEAMASGCPVICSNSSSLPEVVDETALLFNPNDAKAIATNLERVWKNDSLLEELVRRGRQQAQKFSWQTSAKKLLSILSSPL